MNITQFLHSEKKLYEGLIDRLDILISLCDDSKNIENQNNATNNFPSDNFNDQILFIINKENRFLHNKEIAIAMLNHYDNKLNINQMKNRISIALNRNKSQFGDIIKYKYSNAYKDTVWGKKEWLDKNAVPKPSYMYKSR
ncbi:hypothetical protein NAL32_14465 [Chryseobacterium sp. Ch-15]|uniref:Uncharacterized protein n=1 Tax=Chryseobacterium muglaense TaxID=2893752 RepID=A0A9Q3UWG9_9FLAO|nr:hypothetical protein [Chryseobacterium muglaense]MBD3905513.1 hypothetical protein [Chryseobacterium muglaense]MCC9035011.1 hypothetical protein [Chryseobacterium muglaense]MCC9037033.1 hypothetical protein [Chryseobacterium muglaense]MCM2555584.1 hypothetical protein [Chryseobacterium muglaense]